MDSNSEAFEKACILNKESIQRRHYFILAQLQNMVRKVEK